MITTVRRTQPDRKANPVLNSGLPFNQQANTGSAKKSAKAASIRRRTQVSLGGYSGLEKRRIAAEYRPARKATHNVSS